MNESRDDLNTDPQQSSVAAESSENKKVDRRQDSRAAADKMLREAKLFRANIEHPKGTVGHDNLVNINPNLNFQQLDDEFFHLTCHIDSSLMEKIKKGQFIELERLLPSDKFKRDSTRFEWCVKDGSTFLTPAEKEKKITNVRKWDQAFRMYASIYCRANPDRAGEVWQYIEVIHKAAAAYIWDNVAKYDYIFRHLMEYNPGRSWAITYSHMWNITLVEPLNKNNN